MSDYRTSDGFSKTYTTKDVVIASGASLAAAIDLEQLNITGFLIPASWTTAKLTFQASPDGVTYGDVQDSSGNEIQITVAAGKFVGVNLSELSGIRFLKVRSGTSGSPVTQGADRTISIALTNNAEASAGSSGGGGAATIADGADVTEGAIADAAVAAGATGTLSAKLRRISTDINTLLTQTDGIEGSLSSIDGKVPASPATTAKQDTGNTSLASIDTKLPASPATTGKQDTGNTSLGNIDTNAGATGDASVAAGATGSLSAKLRRISADIGSILTRVLSVTLPMQAKANFTITLASLANGTARQSTLISNSGNYPAAIVSLKIVSGGSAPTAGTVYEVYLLRSDGTLADDAAGASDAAITIENAPLLGTIVVTATTAKAFYGVFDTAPLGPLGSSWGIAVKNSTGNALSSTEGDHVKDYQYYNSSQG